VAQVRDGDEAQADRDIRALARESSTALHAFVPD
jgi:hypothetical protein